MKKESDQGPEDESTGIWTRVSHQRAVEMDSPEVHEYRALKYAESEGKNVVARYRLDAVSGRSLLDHPEMQRMLKDVESGKIKYLIISKLARLGRNVKELLMIAEIFRANGAHIISLAEKIDTATPIGRVFYAIIAALAQWEREEIGSRIRAAIHTRAQMGKTTNGKAVYGYKWENGRLVVVKKEARIRVVIYRLYAQVKRFRTVARMVNDLGFKMRGDVPFSHDTIKNLIKDTTADGRRRSCYTCCTDGKQGRRAPEEWVWNAAPRIVSRRLWQACNEIAVVHEGKEIRTGRQSQYVLGNLVWCGCGRKMYVNGQDKWFRCSACRNKVHLIGLENAFLDQLNSGFAHEEAVSIRLDAVKKAEEMRKNSVNELKRNLAATDRKIDNLIELFNERQISKTTFGERNTPLEKEKLEIGEKLRTIGESNGKASISLKASEVAEEVRALCCKWLEMGTLEKQSIANKLVNRIEVHEDIITICFKTR